MKNVTQFAAVILLTACGADRPANQADFAVEVVDGIEHRRNSGEAQAWTARRVARIGSTADGPAAFGRIRSVLADADGNVYVADNLASEVRVFDAGGAHLRSFGRSGGGPGEFGNLYSLAWVGSDLAVMDPGNIRIGRFTRDGGWVDGTRFYPITGPGTLVRLHPLGDVGYYTPVVAANQAGLPFVRMTAAGAADTIAAPRAPETAPQFWTRCDRPDGGIMAVSVPDAPTIVYGFPAAGGQVAVAWTADYRIAFRSPAGDTLHVVERARAPLAYPDSMWQEALRPLREVRDNYPGTRCDPATPERPATRSALRSIAFDETGRMWVEAATTNGFAWDIFDEDGRLLGSVPAPARDAGVPVYVRGNRLYQVERDEMDVQYVVVYEIGA